jgi:predicted transcriptional regulator
MKLDKGMKVKQQRIVGTEKFLNARTGEVCEMEVVEKVVNDYNFHKVWLMDLLGILDLIGTQKIKVLEFLFSEMRNSDNTVSVTYRYIAEKTGISYRTVADTMKTLQEANLIQRVRTGLYMFNPSIVVKGNGDKRRNLVIKYITEEEARQPKLPLEAPVESDKETANSTI